MSYTLGSAWQRYATADELINIRHFYSIEGVPVPITQLDGTAYGYYPTIADKEQEKNYVTFYRDMFGKINKYGKKEYRILKPQFLKLQQIISDRFNVISYIPEDRFEQNKYPSQNTKISTRPAGPVKAPRPDVFDPGQEAYEEQLLDAAGGVIEEVTTSGTAYPTTYFPVIPETEIENWYWVKKPSGVILRIKITEKSKRKLESIGWIFNKNNIWDDKPKPEDKTITANMITQRIDHFTIENGRAKGQITFTLNDNFNPFYYNKDITNIIQFKTKAGANILPFVKQNRLRFTETERDEQIQYDESMQNNTVVDMESFVWLGTTTPTAFSSVLRSEIKEGQAASTTSEGFMAMGITGAIALLIGIGLILPDRMGRKK